jgi:hypothetical protein
MGLAVVGLAAVPAFADGGIYSAEGGSYVGWTSNGDKITVCDEKKDGHSAAGKLWIKQPGSVETGPREYFNTNGVNTCTSLNLSWIAENSRIRIQACRGKNLQIVESTCGVIRTDSA